MIKKLEHVVNLYLGEISLIGVFANSIEQYLTEKLQYKPKIPFSKKEKEHIKEICEFLTNPAKDNSVSKIEVPEEIANFVLNKAIAIKQKTILAEMSLVYLVSYQEGFIKDYFYKLFINKKEMLKSSTKISYEEIINYTSIETIISTMAEKEINSIGYGSIDDMAVYIEKKFNINLSEFHNWGSLREINYRRNIIIHNRGRTNSVYCTKTGYNEKNKHLDTDFKYISKAVNIVESFIKFLHDRVLNKF